MTVSAKRTPMELRALIGASVKVACTCQHEKHRGSYWRQGGSGHELNGLVREAYPGGNCGLDLLIIVTREGGRVEVPLLQMTDIRTVSQSEAFLDPAG